MIKFSINDKTIYKSIIIGIDQTTKVKIKTTQVIKNKNRSWFPFHLKCLIFKEKKWISEINSMDITVINGRIAFSVSKFIKKL